MQQSTQDYFPADYQFNLSDFALFLSVMKNKRAYECTLSIILDEPDIQLKDVKVEQVILNHTGKRAIRLDAWACPKTNDNSTWRCRTKTLIIFPNALTWIQCTIDLSIHGCLHSNINFSSSIHFA